MTKLIYIHMMWKLGQTNGIFQQGTLYICNAHWIKMILEHLREAVAEPLHEPSYKSHPTFSPVKSKKAYKRAERYTVSGTWGEKGEK